MSEFKEYPYLFGIIEYISYIFKYYNIRLIIMIKTVTLYLEIFNLQRVIFIYIMKYLIFTTNAKFEGTTNLLSDIFTLFGMYFN